MKMEKVSDHCYAFLNEKNRLCDSNSGFINLGDGLLIDTQCDLAHAEELKNQISKICSQIPGQVVLTHEDADHVWGNQLFRGSEIIAHQSVPERMKEVANPENIRKLQHAVRKPLARLIMKLTHPGLLAAGRQLQEDYDFDGIELVEPTTLFEDRKVLDLNGYQIHLIHVGPCHQAGDALVHFPEEGVLYTGDVLFNECTPMGWTGTIDNWVRCLDRIRELNPSLIVPGHGPVCGLDEVEKLKSYFLYVQKEARKYFDQGLSSMEASKRIDFGPYANWHAPQRLYMNVERVYRELSNVPSDAPWELAEIFDSFYALAKAKGIRVVF